MHCWKVALLHRDAFKLCKNLNGCTAWWTVTLKSLQKLHDWICLVLSLLVLCPEKYIYSLISGCGTLNHNADRIIHRSPWDWTKGSLFHRECKWVCRLTNFVKAKQLKSRVLQYPSVGCFAAVLNLCKNAEFCLIKCPHCTSDLSFTGTRLDVLQFMYKCSSDQGLEQDSFRQPLFFSKVLATSGSSPEQWAKWILIDHSNLTQSEQAICLVSLAINLACSCDC